MSAHAHNTTSSSGTPGSAGGFVRPPRTPPAYGPVMDELHLMLRIFDVLLRNVIFMAIKQDQLAKTGQQHMELLKAAVQSCGVTFEIWDVSVTITKPPCRTLIVYTQ